MHSSSIAIIGGGFSGLMMACALVKQAVGPFSIFLVEQFDRQGKGVAYSTRNLGHPLNVRASRMGTNVEDPECFYRWVKQNCDLPCTPDSFLPRAVYGEYLEELWQRLFVSARQKGLDLFLINRQAVDLSDGEKLRLFFDDGDSVEVSRLIMATGVQTFKRLEVAKEIEGDPRYLAHIWGEEAQNKIRSLSGRERVCLIGTGLTMVDAVASLASGEFKGEICAISPTGELPGAHLEHPSKPIQIKEEDCMFSSPKALLRFLNCNMRKARDWRVWIDALRPYTQTIWANFSVEQRKQFLRHAASYWNKMRHRMAPESARLLNRLIEEGRLRLIAGKIGEIESEKGTLKVKYRAEGNFDCVTCDFLINAAGPEYRIERQENPLIRRMLQKKIVRPDVLGLGFASNEIGEVCPKIYAMGALLFGEKFETTAAPEIVKQAQILARSILRL